MKVKVTGEGSGFGRVFELSTLLTPTPYAYSYSGSLERSQATADMTAESFGRLAALLVEKGIITLEEAGAAAGVGCTFELVK